MDKHNHNAQNVIRMAEYKPETGYTAVAQVEAYWEALRGMNQLPKRSQIDPRGIEMALENTFILERIAPGIARLRIAGGHLNDLMGMEVRGMPLTALFCQPARRGLSDLLEEVFQMPATATVRMVSHHAQGKPALQGRMVLLPLRSDLGDVSRILGCLVAQGDVGLAPRRFEMLSKDIRRLGRGPDAGSARPPMPAPAGTSVPGFAEPATRFEPNGGLEQSANRPSYLRVVRSDDSA